MDRDRLTSRGWAWHQGLVRYLDVEEAMFQCTGGCKSCDEHSEELESATQYATRVMRQPTPHMDAIEGEKLRTLSNRELGNELDRWADNRDRIPKLDSIALRITAERLRRMAEGCEHPAGYIWRNETEDFCQQCGAVVDEGGNTVSKYADAQPDVWCDNQKLHAWHPMPTGICPGTPTATRPRAPRGGSRADGPLLSSEPDEPCPCINECRCDSDVIGGYDDEESVGPMPKGPFLHCYVGWGEHDAHQWGMRDRLYCDGLGPDRTPCALSIRHDSHTFDNFGPGDPSWCDGQGASVIWAEAHEGVVSNELHSHPGEGRISGVTHSHFVSTGEGD